MPVPNFTTAVSATRSVSEIQALLGRNGATRVLISFEDQEPIALLFEYDARTYILPCHAQRVYDLIKDDSSVPNGLRTRSQAARIAWRILKDWLEAQFALIRANLASADQLFFPFLIVEPKSQQTAYDAYRHNQKLLEEKP